MALTKIKLGKLIILSEDKNSDNIYGVEDVKGISIQKRFIETKADMEDVSLRPYLLVKPNDFAYVTVTSRNGEKITLAHNTTEKTYIVSSSYIVFRVIRTDILLSDYLFMFFNRPEFDRYSRFNSWGSARETFSWEEMCDIEIELPSIEIQRKYVEIYKGMVDNQIAYETGLEDLFLVCQGFIERAKTIYPLDHIGNYISFLDEKNKDNAITLEQGINIKKEFITPQRSNSSLSNRKIVRSGQFAFCTQLNNENVAIAYRIGEDCIVSSVYNVFEIIKKDKLINEYLMLWLIRPEFGRFVYWASVGSAYEFLSNESIINYQIPIPPIEIQRAIVDIYNAYIMRKEINEQLKQQIKNICPVLIKVSVEEAKRS